MLSKLLFNFAAVFFILYISATSATPAAQPASVELQKTNDDIHARARPPYSPYFCQYPYAWQRRECRTSIGPRAWQDVCTHSSYASRFQVEYDNIQGSCPPQTFCMDTVDGYNKRFIRCVRGTPGKRKREDPQTGWSQRKRARPTLANTQLEFSVKIENDMTGASVAAVIGSECSNCVCSSSYISLLMVCRESIKFR